MSDADKTITVTVTPNDYAAEAQTAEDGHLRRRLVNAAMAIRDLGEETLKALALGRPLDETRVPCAYEYNYSLIEFLNILGAVENMNLTRHGYDSPLRFNHPQPPRVPSTPANGRKRRR